MNKMKKTVREVLLVDVSTTFGFDNFFSGIQKKGFDCVYSDDLDGAGILLKHSSFAYVIFCVSEGDLDRISELPLRDMAQKTDSRALIMSFDVLTIGRNILERLPNICVCCTRDKTLSLLRG